MTKWLTLALATRSGQRLLRFLHDRRFERLGDATERKADVRLVAATNRALEDEVKAGHAFARTCSFAST